VAKELKIFDD